MQLVKPLVEGADERGDLSGGDRGLGAVEQVTKLLRGFLRGLLIEGDKSIVAVLFKQTLALGDGQFLGVCAVGFEGKGFDVAPFGRLQGGSPALGLTFEANRRHTRHAGCVGATQADLSLPLGDGRDQTQHGVAPGDGHGQGYFTATEGLIVEITLDVLALALDINEP